MFLLGQNSPSMVGLEKLLYKEFNKAYDDKKTLECLQKEIKEVKKDIEVETS